MGGMRVSAWVSYLLFSFLFSSILSLLIYPLFFSSLPFSSTLSLLFFSHPLSLSDTFSNILYYGHQTHISWKLKQTTLFKKRLIAPLLNQLQLILLLFSSFSIVTNIWKPLFSFTRISSGWCVSVVLTTYDLAIKDQIVLKKQGVGADR